MEENTDFKENSQAVQLHLNILQSVINRMAGNSSSAKSWCITIVSAVLVIVADKGKPQYAWIAVIPTVLFFLLDIYYLALEKGFRDSYNEFVAKLHSQSILAEDLFVVSPKGGPIKLFFLSIISFSIWPFYLALIAMICAAKAFVLGNL